MHKTNASAKPSIVSHPVAQCGQSISVDTFAIMTDRSAMIVELKVPDDFRLPCEYDALTPEETADVLTVACRLAPYCRDVLTTGSIEHLVKKYTQTEATQELREAKEEVCKLNGALRTLEAEVDTRVQKAVSETEYRSTRTLQAKLSSCEGELRKVLQAQCDARERDRDLDRQRTDLLLELKAKVHELERPTAVGRLAEVDVAELLRSAGFYVEDTSMGEKKTAGYLDLLIRPNEESNVRLAIEIKNKQTVQRDDLDDFESKVKRGIASGMFDAAVFLSLRAHTKQTSTIHVDMFPDATGKPIVPVLWFGPEKGRHVQPLTQEAIESVAWMMTSLLSKCHEMRRDLHKTEDVDMRKVQAMTTLLLDDFTSLFADLTKQYKTLDDLRTQVTHSRARCIRMFHSLWETNRNVIWLSREVHVPWMDSFLLADSQTDTMKESEIWNRLSKQKAVVERHIGKDAMFVALRARKRVRGESGARGGEADESRPEEEEEEGEKA